MKQWWQSKAIWAAIGLILLALFHYYKTNDINKTVELILQALGLIGIRLGNKKIA